MARAPYITASAAGTRDTAHGTRYTAHGTRDTVHGQDMTATGCMMRACLALCVAAALVGAARAHCDGCLDGECYRKHRLPVDTGMHIWALDINRQTNTVYIHTDYSDKLVQCQLDTDLCYNMTNTQEIFSLTVDQRSGDVYGTIDGSIYKLDLVNNEKKLLLRAGVPHIAFKDKLYYATYANGIYTYEDRESRVVAGSEGYKVWDFVVDKNDDIYFRTHSNVRRLSKGVIDPTVPWYRHHVMVDRDGNAVLLDLKSHAVYRITNGEVTEVGAITDYIVKDDRPLFDRDNNIFYRTRIITNDYFHLKREKGVRCTVSILENKRIITETVANTETTDDLTSTTPTYTIESTTSESPDGTTEYYDVSPSTPGPESISSTFPDGTTEDYDGMSPSTPAPVGSGASRSGPPGQVRPAGHEH